MASLGNIFSPGDVIDDRYRIVRLVGTGGMGEVYEAERLETGERVAIKTVLPDLLGNSKILARFEREAELSRRISHPCILRIFEVLKIPGSTVAGAYQVPCMVMELLAGETIADRLIDGRTVEPEAAVSLACQMASGLTAAHRAGVVHRDFKPDNIFLVPSASPPPGERPPGQRPPEQRPICPSPAEPEGECTRVVLTDFGVARRSATPARDDALTASNVLLGTPDYLAPELLELEDAMPASDIYSLGLVLFEMITGERPFVADSPIKTIFKRIEEEPPSPRTHLPNLDRRWEEVILRCLARKPENRYAEAQDLIRVLEGDSSRWLLSTTANRFEKLIPWLVAAVIAAGVAAVILW